MAKPIKVTILGDVNDLLGSLSKGESGIAGFADKVSSAASSVAATAAKFAAASLAAAGIGNAIGDALDQAQLSAKLGAQLGATAEQSKQYGEIAGRLYAQGYGDSFEQVTEAVKSVVQNIQGMGKASASELQYVGQMALNTAQIFDQDLGRVTAAVGQLMKTGLAANAAEAFDIITTGLQNGANKSDDLLDTFNEYSTQFRDLGLTGQQALGLLSQGLAAGARDSDTVADALKELAIKAKDGTKVTADGFATIGLSASEMARVFAEGGPRAAQALDTILDRLRGIEDPAKRSQTAVALFGTKAEDLQQALFALDASTAVAALGNVAGAATRAGDSFHDNAQAKLETFTRGLQQGFVNLIGGYVIPLVERLANWFNQNLAPAFEMVGSFISGTLVPALMGFAHWVQENHTWLLLIAGVIAASYIPALIEMAVQSVKNGALAAGSWIATRVEALASLGAHVTAFATMVAGWVLMGAQALLRAAEMAAAWVIALGPVGWVIGAIVALVALIVANWDTVKQWTIDAWNAIVGAVRAAVQWVIDGVSWLGQLPGKVLAWFGSVKDGAVRKLGELVSWLGGLPGQVLRALGDFGSLLLDVGRDLLSGLWRGIQNAAGWLRDKIIGFFKSLIPGWLRDALGINSPSKVTAEIGRWIPPGLAVGIEQTAHVATDAAADMASGVVRAVADASLPEVSGGAVARIEATRPGPGSGFAPTGTGAARGFPATGTRSEPARQNITVNVTSNADPDRIGREVAWAIRNQGR